MNQVGDSTACRVFVVIECKLRYTEMSTPSRSLGHPVYKHRCGRGHWCADPCNLEGDLVTPTQRRERAFRNGTRRSYENSL